MNNFQSPDDIIVQLFGGKQIITELFNAGDSAAYSESRALMIISEDKLTQLQDNGIIESNDGYLSLGKAYADLFNKVLGVNTTLNINLIQDYIDDLKNNIRFYDIYTKEENERKKRECLREIKRLMTDVGGTIHYNVIELKQTINDTYKNEDSLIVKQQKLEILREKREHLFQLISAVFKLLAENDSFFKLISDLPLQRERNLLSILLVIAEKNVRHLQRTIVDFINDVEAQSELLKKIQILKRYKDQQRLISETNFVSLVNGRTPLWMQPRGWHRCKPSLRRLYENDKFHDYLLLLRDERKLAPKSLSGPAPVLSEKDFHTEEEFYYQIDYKALLDSFKAKGMDLFRFIMTHDFGVVVTRESRINIFCELVTKYAPELNFNEDYGTDGEWEFQIIKP